MRTILYFILIFTSSFAYETTYETMIDRSYHGSNMAYQRGVTLLLGEDTKSDLNASLKWFKRASKKGYLPAHLVLAKLHIKGVGLTQDFTSAFNYYYKAAKMGHLEARAQLGFFYLRGIGVKQSYVKAEYWLKLAALENHIDASKNLGYLYATAPQPLFKPSLAIRYLEPLAKNGDKKAALHIGELYAIPYTATRSLSQAKYWLEQAVWLGNGFAHCPLLAFYKRYNILDGNRELQFKEKLNNSDCK
jgi:uncharacterized protein